MGERERRRQGLPLDHRSGKRIFRACAGGHDAVRGHPSATLQAAKLLHMDDKVGVVEPGKLLDIVAVPGNPLDQISLTEKVDFVMKDGAVCRGPQTKWQSRR